MVVYRIDREKYIPTVLTGLGAARHGGRWNLKNTPAIYASASRALAMLEILVHTRTVGLLPSDRVLVSIEIPDNHCLRVDSEAMPINWDALPTPMPWTKQLFELHCVKGNHGGLQVPSVILPQEFNFVLTPNHPNFSTVKVVDVEALNWDLRLQ